MRKQTYLIVAQGPGETSQARALADYLFRKGGRIIFLLHQALNARFLENDRDRFDICVTEDVTAFYTAVRTRKPDVLLLFNSKIWSGTNYFHNHPPTPRPLTVCVDSNWLFNTEAYPPFRYVEWADKYLINIPDAIFQLGFQEHGGKFTIPASVRSNMVAIGFIPSYSPLRAGERRRARAAYHVPPHEKLVFAYFSGFGAGHRAWALESLLTAVTELVRRRQAIRVIITIPEPYLTARLTRLPWLHVHTSLSADEFHRALAASDLVFQHQGLATLAQAICTRVPVIVNVAPDAATPALPSLHFWEVEPFVRAGVCRLHQPGMSPAQVGESLSSLLFDEEERQRMQTAQGQHSEHGEEKASVILQDLLRQHDASKTGSPTD